MSVLRVGSRDSKLAVIQAQMVIDAVRAYDPALDIQLVTMKTTGDRILDRTLAQIGGKGLFVKELDQALLEGRVDITVHSFKDLPMDTDPALPIVAAGAREDPRDVLVLPAGVTALDPEKPIGCASSRRKIQMERLFPHMDVRPVRGNVQTRLKKLDERQYSALVLAAAGLRRLGLAERISRVFAIEEILPAACQGIVAVQARAGEDTEYLSRFQNGAAMACALAERAFVRALDGGCTSPVAAYARFEGDEMVTTGMYVSPDLSAVRFGTEQTAPADAVDAAHKMAEDLRK